MTELAPQTVAALNQVLPAHWSHSNPVDILDDADPERYAKALESAAQDPHSDGLLVILTPQPLSDPTLTAELVKRFATTTGKPVPASWMGGAEVASGITILNRAGIPTFLYPDTAAQIFEYMWRYTSNLQSMYETPHPALEFNHDGPDRTRASKLLETARQSERTLLSAGESLQLLAAYGIPTVQTLVATHENEAVERAEDIGYPVVLKLLSETITHKADVNGVRLHLAGADAVRHAYQAIEASVREQAGAEHFQGVIIQPMLSPHGYELILGSSIDSQFGPVLLFGSGGHLVEVYHDRALGLPPLTTTLARRMMEQTRVFHALQGMHGRPPVDLAAIEELLVRFSYLVIEQRWIKEIDINPLLASAEQLLVLDARVVLHGSEITEESLPHLAIRPYPSQYVRSWTLPNGASVTLRPIHPEDEPQMVTFHAALSERSVYLRWFHILNLSRRTAHTELIRLCFIDYDREMALVGEYTNPHTGQGEIIGVGHLIKLNNANEAEMAMLVTDEFQRKGLGTELLRRLIQFGHDESLQRPIGEILVENKGMQEVCRKLGFYLQYSSETWLVRAELEL